MRIVAVALIVWNNRAERQREASKWVSDAGARVEFDFEFTEDFRRERSAEPNVPEWLLKFLDVHYFANVVNVNGVQPRNGDLSAVADLVHLRGLTIDTRLTTEDLKFLSSLKELERLTFANPEQLTELNSIAGLTKLQELWLESSQVSSLAPLANFAELRELKITNAKFDDLSPLRNLSNLEKLDVGGCEISDLEPLTDLTSLLELDVGDTRIDDITSLVGLKNLRYLNLGSNPIADFSPIEELQNLKYLNLQGTGIDENSLQRLTMALPKCKVFADGAR